MARTKRSSRQRGISLKTLRSRVASGNVADVYLLVGQEALLHEEAIQALRATLFPDQSAAEFDVDLVYGDEVSAEDLAARVTTAPFMAKRRLVVVRRAEQLKEMKSVLEQDLPGRGASVLVLDYSPGKSFAGRLPGTLVDLAPPKSDSLLLEWLTERWKARGVHLTREGAKRLIELVATSPDRREVETTVLSDLENEMDKLQLFVHGDQAIGPEEVVAVVGSRPDQSLYAFSEALLHCRAPAASAIAESLGLSRRYLEATLPQVGLDLLRLMRLKAALDEGVPRSRLAAAAGVWPTWVSRWRSRAQAVSWRWLGQTAGLLYRADRDVKRGRIDLPRALDLVIASVGGSTDQSRATRGSRPPRRRRAARSR